MLPAVRESPIGSRRRAAPVAGCVGGSTDRGPAEVRCETVRSESLITALFGAISPATYAAGMPVAEGLQPT
jgi:hypothetical protein